MAPDLLMSNEAFAVSAATRDGVWPIVDMNGSPQRCIDDKRPASHVASLHLDVATILADNTIHAITQRAV